MKTKYAIPILVVFVFLVPPKNILFGNDDRSYYYDLGVSHYDKGDIDNAISAWEKATIVNPEFVEAYYNLGNAYEEKGLLEKAISSWAKVIETTPFDIDVYFNMGVVYTRKGMYAEAKDIFRKGIKVDPDDPGIH